MKRSIAATWRIFAVTFLVSVVWIGGMAACSTADSPIARDGGKITPRSRPEHRHHPGR